MAPVSGFAVFGVTDQARDDKLHRVIRRQRRSFMVARGRVQNGVVVLADGVRLPEGQEVTVLAPPPAGSKAHGILDIPPVSLGAVVHSITADDDLLGEMLESRS
jgi:hypothetical protein